jgi:hypothetical protein
MLPTIVHEFCHSYANPIIDRHQDALAEAGKKLYAPVADRMRSQAYANPQTMLRESLVRVSVVRYVNQSDGPAAATSEVRRQIGSGFHWMEKLSGLLAEYEADRDRYPTLESFAPRLVSFFNDYAPNLEAEQPHLAAGQAKIVSMVPANNATNVDPGVAEIKVEFDRPMQDGSWSLCGSGPAYPETVGRPRYDSSRKVWTVGVRLKPDWQYHFSLNAPDFQGFRTADGTPLTPVPVSFRTGPARP